jgi:hypothetical protein
VCILGEQRFDFLKDLVATVPDVQGEEDFAETPTPTPTPSSAAVAGSSSTSAFVYPTPQPSVGASAALGAAPGDEMGVVSSSRSGPSSSSGIVLNPPGITSNPYIPSIGFYHSAPPNGDSGHNSYHHPH